MSASDEAHSKKCLVEVNPSQSLPWKQNGTTVVTAVMILQVVNNWRSMLPSATGNACIITILEWLVSTWHIHLTEISEEKHFILSNYLNQI